MGRLFAILEFAYNSAKHATIGFSPFMLMYGYQPRSQIVVGLANERIQQVKDFLQDHFDMLKVACQNVWQAQDCYKHYVDKQPAVRLTLTKVKSFLYEFQNSTSLKIGPIPKLSVPQYCGPFTIFKKVRFDNL